MKTLALFLAAACAASAQEFALPAESGALAARARALAARPQAPAALSSADRAAAAASLAGFARLHDEGVWGGGKADPLPETARAGALAFRAAAAVSPLNRGFLALGPAGATGKVKAGFLGLGNGDYRVHQNDAFQIVFEVHTNYIDGRFTLKRDQATGKDALGFTGRLKDPSTNIWSSVDAINPGTVTYDPSSDSGTIGWRLKDQPKQDSYRNGGSGGDMTITLSGNEHEFVRD